MGWVKPGGEEWEKQEKCGQTRQTKVGLLDRVGVKTTQARPAFRLQVLHNSLNHPKTWKQKYPTLSDFQFVISRNEKFVFQTFDKIGKWKWPRSRIPPPLRVSVWEWLSLNGSPPDEAEKSGTVRSPSDCNKTRLRHVELINATIRFIVEVITTVKTDDM